MSEPPAPDRHAGPYQPPINLSNATPADQNKEIPSAVAYNVMTDLVTGVNVRSSDNKFQAVFIGCTVLASALSGVILSRLQPSWNLPWYGGALVGGFLGLIFGFFASGIFLMIYRALRHIQGKHD